MMLKIRNGHTWVFYDDLREVRIYDLHQYVFSADDKALRIDDSNKAGTESYRDATYHDDLFGVVADGEVHEGREMILNYRDGSHAMFFVAADAYLLNDVGKTIEVLRI